jgi:hypothetical protein
MADLDITIRRKNGATYDVLHPTTIISQVTGLQTALDAKINTSARGAANGVASLDANSKILVSQLPSTIVGGLKFAGSFGAGTPSGPLNLASFITGTVASGYSISANLDSISGVTHPAYDATAVQYIGYYWIAGVNLQIEDETTDVADWQTAPAVFDDGLNPVDSGGGITTQGLTLEAGDWLIITGYNNTTKAFIFNVINNTYANATTTTAGVTTLSDGNGGVLTGLAGNPVVNEAGLLGLTYTAGTDLNGLTGANLDKLAKTNHTHSQYLGISATAATATKLATARTIAASGDGTWSVSFDGSANVTAGLTLATVATAGTYKSVTVNAKGLVTAGTNPTTLSGYGITDAQPLDADLTSIAGLTGTTGFLKKTAANTWSLDTSSYITGNQSISVSGDASGSGTTSIALTLATVATAGTYRSVTVNAKGLVTSGTNPTTISGYGITDAYTTTAVDNLLLNRPEIYYNAAGNSNGDIILDLDSDGAIS